MLNRCLKTQPLKGSNPLLLPRKPTSLFQQNARLPLRLKRSLTSDIQDGTQTQEQAQHISTPSATVSKSRQPRRYLRGFLWSFFFLSVGYFAGKRLSVVVSGPQFIPDDKDVSDLAIAALKVALGKLPIVQELRSQPEIWEEYEAYTSQSPEGRASQMTSGAMRGINGLGMQKIFWNERDKKLVSVVFFGSATCGWPGVVHGGALATILQENLERVANGRKTASGSGRAEKMVLDQIDITYKKPSPALSMFIIRADIDDGSLEPGYDDDRHVKVKATLENAENGQLCARATGRCSMRESSFIAGAAA